MSAKKKKKQAETEMKVKITWKEVKQQKVLLFCSYSYIWDYLLLPAFRRMAYGIPEL